MTRLIDADALKDDILKSAVMIDDRDVQTGCEIAIELIKVQPTVDVPHWIPCSERLPDDDEYYLVTDGEEMMVGFWRDDAKAWDNSNYGWVVRDNKESKKEPVAEFCGIGGVIAWMPLPKPYEGAENDTAN